MAANQKWWRGAVIYQIYPRSFMDSNGDGIGDLRGITSKLDYVADLGVDAIWITPFYTSPMRDFGYDVADYRSIDPIFGDLDDFKRLLRRAHSLNLKVVVDQVLSHTSDLHPWFVESRAVRNGGKSDWFVWADAASDGSPPNNWLSVFGGSAWTWDNERSQYYLHNFLASQPDLNFHNEDVRAAQLDNVRFWLDLGVDGFRFDVVNFYFHNQDLCDNPPVGGKTTINPGASPVNPYFKQYHIHDIDQPDNLEFLRRLRLLMDEYPDCTSVGEISSDNSLDVMAAYTSGGDKLHMAYTFDLLNTDRDARYLRKVIRRLESKIQDGWPCWALSNHDVVRSASRWGHGEDARMFPRIAVALLLSLRGSVSLYQGEELGLPETEVAREHLQDPYGIEFWPEYKGRDGCRTPMVWSHELDGGFSNGSAWLPVDKCHLPLAIDRQSEDPQSVLSFVKRLIHWRKSQPALVSGDLELVQCDNDLLCWIRSSSRQRLLVALNMTGIPTKAALPVPLVGLLEGHGFSGRIEDGQMVLGPYDALFASVQ